MTPQGTSEAVVAGAGPVGLATALALAREGVTTALVAPPPPDSPTDTRTAALFPGTVALLQNLGAWDDCRAAAEPLIALRIVDGTGNLLRAPEVLFRASEMGLEAFAWNVPNRVLTQALRRAADIARDRLTLFETAAVSGLEIGDASVLVARTGAPPLTARLVAAADGRASLCRAAAGIATETWTYDQTAIACSFSHSRAHRGVSTEFHRAAGPLTTVPLPGRTSSLVWVERPALAKDLAGYDETQFRAALEAKLEGLLGAIWEIGPRSAFPLSGLSAATLGTRRVALLGEAAHVLPPIGAQGLNLGFRDAATLAQCVGMALKEGRDIGGPETLAAYRDARKSDVASRTQAVGLLNRTLLASHVLPVHLARGLGLFAVQAFGPLRRRLMQGGFEPAHLPPLMRLAGQVRSRPYPLSDAPQ